MAYPFYALYPLLCCLHGRARLKLLSMIQKKTNWLSSVSCQHAIVWDLPQQNDYQIRITYPMSDYIQLLMFGGISPPAALKKTGSADHWNNARPIGPLTYNQALQYIAEADVPQGARYVIVRINDIPEDRSNRDKWLINQFKRGKFQYVE